MTSYITAIGTANPENKLLQTDIAEFMATILHMTDTERRKLQVLYRATGIKYRHSVLEDFGHTNTQNFTFFPENISAPFPGVAERMELYRHHAIGLAKAAVLKVIGGANQPAKETITHLITVSCTGMYAPGLDIDLVEQLGFSTQIQRTAINFMGCYGVFNGLKVADAICKTDPEAKVLVISVELCTIHFQKSTLEDQLLSAAIFADGAAAALVEARPSQPFSLSMEAFHCDLFPRGKTDMAWHIGNFGFEMVLSSYVPDLIGEGISHLLTQLMAKIGCSRDEIAHFAIHPGGKRILEQIEKSLGMTKADNGAAYHVLREFGNMSSTTVLFVLAHLQASLKLADSGKRVLSMAFGPGLTLESMMLKIA